MAHKKGVGSSRNGRDSDGQRLGCKKFGGELVKAGNIIYRQRGMAAKDRGGLDVFITEAMGVHRIHDHERTQQARSFDQWNAHHGLDH